MPKQLCVPLKSFPFDPNKKLLWKSRNAIRSHGMKKKKNIKKKRVLFSMLQYIFPFDCVVKLPSWFFVSVVSLSLAALFFSVFFAPHNFLWSSIQILDCSTLILIHFERHSVWLGWIGFLFLGACFVKALSSDHYRELNLAQVSLY